MIDGSCLPAGEQIPEIQTANCLETATSSQAIANGEIYTAFPIRLGEMPPGAPLPPDCDPVWGLDSDSIGVSDEVIKTYKSIRLHPPMLARSIYAFIQRSLLTEIQQGLIDPRLGPFRDPIHENLSRDEISLAYGEAFCIPASELQAVNEFVRRKIIIHLGYTTLFEDRDFKDFGLEDSQQPASA